MGKKVMVKDLVVGNTYIISDSYNKLTNVTAKLIYKEIAGWGGAGYQEPYYELRFENVTIPEGQRITKDWQEELEEVNTGGKRRSQRSYRKNKSRKKLNKI